MRFPKKYFSSKYRETNVFYKQILDRRLELNLAKKQTEADKNFDAFSSELSNIITLHRNQFALIRNGKIESFYSTWVDAYTTGEKFYKDGKYTIQKVTDIPEDLGFFSHAVHLR